MTSIQGFTAPTDPRIDQWITIADFSPGIQQKVMTPGIVQPSPGGQGAASILNTYRCISLPGGGLGPLPKRYESFTKGITETADHVQTNMFVIPTMMQTSAFYPFERDPRRPGGSAVPPGRARRPTGAPAPRRGHRRG